MFAVSEHFNSQVNSFKTPVHLAHNKFNYNNTVRGENFLGVLPCLNKLYMILRILSPSSGRRKGYLTRGTQ
jgi:hypothetical protein